MGEAVAFSGEAAVSQATATGGASATGGAKGLDTDIFCMEQDDAVLAAAAKRRETIDGHIADLQKRVDGIKAERKNKGRGRPNGPQANQMATLQSKIVRLQRNLLPEEPSPPRTRPQTTDDPLKAACSTHVPPPDNVVGTSSWLASAADGLVRCQLSLGQIWLQLYPARVVVQDAV